MLEVYIVQNYMKDVQYLVNEIWTMMYDISFHFKFDNVEILNPNLDML
jgi:hypothetical protein